MSKTITAPWTEEQVRNLNEWQKCESVHPFTCGTDGCDGILIASTEGWTCPKCDYTQKWAHTSMGEPIPPGFFLNIEEEIKLMKGDK